MPSKLQTISACIGCGLIMMYCGSYFVWSNIAIYEMSYLFIHDRDNVHASMPVVIDGITNVLLAIMRFVGMQLFVIMNYKILLSLACLGSIAALIGATFA